MAQCLVCIAFRNVFLSGQFSFADFDVGIHSLKRVAWQVQCSHITPPVHHLGHLHLKFYLLTCHVDSLIIAFISVVLLDINTTSSAIRRLLILFPSMRYPLSFQSRFEIATAVRRKQLRGYRVSLPYSSLNGNFQLAIEKLNGPWCVRKALFEPADVHQRNSYIHRGILNFVGLPRVEAFLLVHESRTKGCLNVVHVSKFLRKPVCSTVW